MQFRTEIKPQPSEFRITHQKHILSIGSCFAEHIGNLLNDNKFYIQLNPFGITYNPAAIARSLQSIRKGNLFDKSDLFEHQKIWSSLDHHSRFSGIDPNLVLQLINQEISDCHNRLDQLEFLILTFGTAHAFFHKAEKRIVNNCHKLPADNFERKLLSVEEITKSISSEISALKTLSPNLKVIITVSPVRHIRDGLTGSKLSKATLLLAAHQLASDNEFIEYYPSYELLIDDLRDYRFYKPDLVHPSDEAIGYIWDHFSETYFGEKEKVIINKVKKLKAAFHHRPFFPESEQHRSFLASHLNIANNLKAEYPFLDLEEEIRYFSS